MAALSARQITIAASTIASSVSSSVSVALSLSERFCKLVSARSCSLALLSTVIKRYLGALTDCEWARILHESWQPSQRKLGWSNSLQTVAGPRYTHPHLLQTILSRVSRACLLPHRLRRRSGSSRSSTRRRSIHCRSGGSGLQDQTRHRDPSSRRFRERTPRTCRAHRR